MTEESIEKEETPAASPAVELPTNPANEKPTDGHVFAKTSEFESVRRCRYCSLYEHDYHSLKRGAGEGEPIPCPYVSEKLPPSDDVRVNR